MDGRQSGVQKDRLGNFQWKNCSTELWLYAAFLRLLVASEVCEGGVWCVCACELWRQVWLQNFEPFAVCQEDAFLSLFFLSPLWNTAQHPDESVLQAKNNWDKKKVLFWVQTVDRNAFKFKFKKLIIPQATILLWSWWAHKMKNT